MNLFFSGNVFNIVVRRKCETGQMCKAVVVVDKTLSLILVKLLRHLVSARRLAAHKEEDRKEPLVGCNFCEDYLTKTKMHLPFSVSYILG